MSEPRTYADAKCQELSNMPLVEMANDVADSLTARSVYTEDFLFKSLAVLVRAMADRIAELEKQK